MRSLSAGLATALTMTLAGCATSLEDLQKACDGGNAASCYELGEMLYAGKDVSQDTERGLMLFQRACEGREMKGCTKARQVYEERCRAGFANGCNLLARLYLEGFGVTQDQAKAAELYTIACDRNDSVSCASLARLYAGGRGVAKDPAKALELWTKACRGGFGEACRDLPRE